MKEIQLSYGKVAMVDDDSFSYINQWRWHYSLSSGYAERTIRIGKRTKCIKMHHLVVGKPTGDMEVDHIDRNRLNNTRANLRICTRSQNHQNTGISSRNTSGYKGVYWERCRRKWRALIKYNGRRIHLGYFANCEDAALAYKEAAKEYFGEYSGI